MIERRRDKTGDAAFHVDRAAAVEALAGNLAGKWRMRPGALVTRRNDVGMPGKQQVRLRFADAGIEIVDRRGTGLGEHRPLHIKAGARQEILQVSERAAFVRGHRAAADEIASDGNGVGWHGQSTAGESVITDQLETGSGP